MGEQERLEAAIADDPDDDAAYLVYGDWLQQHGDPRGELITEIGPDPLPCASFPNVKTLIVRATGDEANLAGIALPKLTELRATGEGGGKWFGVPSRRPPRARHARACK